MKILVRVKPEVLAVARMPKALVDKEPPQLMIPGTRAAADTAAKLDVAQISDITALVGADAFERLIDLVPEVVNAI